MGVDGDQQCGVESGRRRGLLSAAAVPPASQVIVTLVLISSSQSPFPSRSSPSVPIFTVDYTSSPLLLSPTLCPFFSSLFSRSKGKSKTTKPRCPAKLKKFTLHLISEFFSRYIQSFCVLQNGTYESKEKGENINENKESGVRMSLLLAFITRKEVVYVFSP